MTATRYEINNTSVNLDTIISTLSDARTDRVILFATETQPTDSFNHHSDGPETNLPLVAALAEFKIPGVAPFYVVFDGLFLTAARQSRYFEVRDLLDASIASGKAFFAQKRAPFTSELSPEEAAQKLLQIAPVVALTNANRSVYFGLLSCLPESAFV